MNKAIRELNDIADKVREANENTNDLNTAGQLDSIIPEIEAVIDDINDINNNVEEIIAEYES